MIFKTKNVIVNRDCGKILPDVYKVNCAVNLC